MSELRIGVLALQGSFREHMTLLRRIPGVEAVEVRTADELRSVAGLIIPGQEFYNLLLLAPFGYLLIVPTLCVYSF